MPTRLIEVVERLPRSRVLLVGDPTMDRYLYGDVERISPEAPVPVLHYQREELRLGGAGNVAANLAVLNADVRVVATIGTDEAGRDVRRLLNEIGVDTAGLIEVPGRPTVTKMRLVGSAQHRHAQTMLRLDYEDRTGIPDGIAGQIVEGVKRAMKTTDVVCVEDYNKGLLTPAVCRAIIAAAREQGKPVIIDPAVVADYSRYAGATAIKLNRVEAAKASDLKVETPDDWHRAAERLLDRLDLQAVIITLDRSGSFLATREGADSAPAERRLLKTRARQVFDVTGAGDMVHAMVTVARAAGATWPEAVALANVAAGLEVERFGCVPIRPEEIIQELLAEVHEHLGKERAIAQVLPELARHRARPRIVFTNGCFDLIHLGHVKYFRYAKAQGDLLVVGVNTDASIRRLKGTKRPIINEHDRLSVLEELESIDYLVRFDEDTPIRLIQQIQPDVLVKGADYQKGKEVVGWDIVEAYGGRIALAPLVDGRSTSAVIQRILEAYSTSASQAG